MFADPIDAGEPPARRFASRAGLSIIAGVDGLALALETSGRDGSLALVDDGALLDHRLFPHGLKHAAELIPLIDESFRRQGRTPRDLRAVFVSVGPGSFTGLRIGVTVAKTLAFALDIPIVAVPSLRVLAENAPIDARHLLVVLDAKRGQVFAGGFERIDGHWIERGPARLDFLSKMIAAAARPLHLMGEGLAFHRAAIPDDPTVIVTPPDLWRGRAETVARLGLILAAAGQFADPDRLTPIYLRKPEAEEKYEALRSIS